MSNGGGGGRGGDLNAPILTTSNNQQPVEKPQGLLEAISEVQQYYVIESQGQDINSDFLTISRTLEFFKIGMKSGFIEGLAVALLIPVFMFFFVPFVLKAPSKSMELFFAAMPFTVVLVNTLLCSYIGRYYVGNITRKSVNSLLTGRTMSLLIQSFLLYVTYYFVTGLSTPSRVWAFAKHLGRWSEGFYYGYLEVLPQMMPVVTASALIMATAAIVPYGMVFSIDQVTRYKIRRNLRSISAQ